MFILYAATGDDVGPTLKQDRVNVCSTLVHCQPRWLRISPILFQRLVFVGYNGGRCHMFILFGATGDVGSALKQDRVNVCSISHSPEITIV